MFYRRPRAPPGGRISTFLAADGAASGSDEFPGPPPSQPVNRGTTREEVGMNETGTGTRITDVGCVGVPTTDQDRSIEFYCGTLGFEKRRDAPFGPGLRWIEVAPPGASTVIALLPTPSGSP